MPAINTIEADAVFEGGGVKGIGLAGALAEAEDRGYRWRHVAGTSAGAIVAALVAAGYTAAELMEMMLALDYYRFQDTGRLDKIPVLGPLTSLILEKGIYEGAYPLEWIRERLRDRGVETFRQLMTSDEDPDRGCRFRLRVIAADLTRGRMLILPDDIADYGIAPEDLNVALAVRMSLSLPFFFEPVILKDMKSGQNSYIVDGGVLSNFPVWLFDPPGGRPERPTLGFKLVEPEEGMPHSIRGPVSMLAALFSTMMEAHDARYIEDKDFYRTIAIPTLGVKTAEFDISRERSQALYRSGREAAERFFETWDFTRYLEKYFGDFPRPSHRGERLRTE
jgi:NTE family protein